jgi:hypothetical protein
MVIIVQLSMMGTVMAAVNLDLAIGPGQLSVNFKIHGLMILRKDVDVCQHRQQVI